MITLVLSAGMFVGGITVEMRLGSILDLGIQSAELSSLTDEDSRTDGHCKESCAGSCLDLVGRRCRRSP